MEELKQAWQDLAERYFHDTNQMISTFQLLQTHYGQSQRHYHSFAHIQTLFNKVDQYQVKWMQPDLVHFAIWFHDVIYDATKSDNERESAKLALATLSKSTSLNQNQLDTIELLILSTEKHTVLLDQADCRLFLDLDLSILGEDWTTYQAYSAQIRQEYQHVPLALYQAGRKQVLQRFLTRDTIYYSKFFIERLETQARSNIQKEITELSR